MPVTLELLPKDRIGLKFKYDKFLVTQIRHLSHRRWNASKTQWEVHLAHLPDVKTIFQLSDDQVPQEIQTAFESEWLGRELRVVLNPLEGQIVGIGAPLEEIDQATSFFIPGYRFSPKFKAGRWDGKQHLLKRQSQKFPRGLWPRIEQILADHKIEYELEELKAEGGEEITCGPPVTELRPYQSEAIEQAIESRRGILQIATGGGKTLVGAHLIRELNQTAWFFVHTKDLLYQTVAVFEQELQCEIGILGDGHAKMCGVNVGTIQTAARVLDISVPKTTVPAEEDPEETAARKEKTTRLGKKKAPIAESIARAGTVIFDECHHVPADTFYKIAFRTDNATHRYGFSATPWRDDRHDLLLEAALGPKVCAVSCSRLIEAGFLIPPTIRMQAVERAKLNASRRLPYADIYKAGIVENPSRNRAIAAKASEWADRGFSVLILVAHIKHGENLQKLLPEARFAYGNLNSDARRELIANLERKLHPILIATTLADEGLDIPTLDTLILAGGGKSQSRAYQRIGRTLRLAEGKSRARVLDFFDPLPYLEEHSRARLELYRQEPAFNVQTRGFKQ